MGQTCYHREYVWNGFSQKEIVTLMLRISQGVRVKVAGIPGGKPKKWEKTWIFRSVSQCEKSGKFQGITVNLTGNPGGQLQKNRYPQQGGG